MDFNNHKQAYYNAWFIYTIYLISWNAKKCNINYAVKDRHILLSNKRI